MTTIRSESTVKPVEWDLISSPNVIYHNYNVVELSPTEDLPMRYAYDVDVYTLSEYQQYANQKQSNIEAALIELAAIVGG